jgi:hypothetical protein
MARSGAAGGLEDSTLGIFFGSGSFLVASQWGSKKTLWSVGSVRLERDGKLKFCRELHWFISGPRNFIQHDWSIGWASNSIFLAQVWNLQISFIRLLMIFYKFNENFKGKLKWSNWVFIELNKYFMKMKPEVTWFGHAWI